MVIIFWKWANFAHFQKNDHHRPNFEISQFLDQIPVKMAKIAKITKIWPDFENFANLPNLKISIFEKILKIFQIFWPEAFAEGQLSLQHHISP